MLEKAPESVVVREEGRGGGANDNSSITKVTNFENNKVATLLCKLEEVRDGVSPENQLKVVRIASASASIAGELWASGALVGKGAWGAWGAGGGGDWGAGKKLCHGHFLNGGCNADGACALAHSVAE